MIEDPMMDWTDQEIDAIVADYLAVILVWATEGNGRFVRQADLVADWGNLMSEAEH